MRSYILLMTDSEQDMHRPVDWLKPSDRPILAEFRKCPGWLKPATIHLNIAYSQQHVQERCRELWKRGFLIRYNVNTAAYQLRQLGQDYLDGKVDVDTLADLDKDDEGQYETDE